MASPEEQVRAEFGQVVEVVTEITGLTSRWSGRAELVSEVPYKGLKSFSCLFRLRADLANDPLRWRTLIHEALHAVSVGLSVPDYQRFRGWEEGVVEQLQRLHRGQILGRLGVAHDEAVYQQEEAAHRFNVYIDALEQLRSALEIGETAPFYLDLLRAPLGDRSSLALRRGYQLPFEQRVGFVRRYSVVNSVLTQGVL